MLTPQSVICGVGVAARTGRGEIPNGARWLGALTYPSVAVLTPQSVICGVGLAARTGRGEISQAGKHTSPKRRYHEYTTRNRMKKMLYFVETTHEVAETVIFRQNVLPVDSR